MMITIKKINNKALNYINSDVLNQLMEQPEVSCAIDYGSNTREFTCKFLKTSDRVIFRFRGFGDYERIIYVYEKSQFKLIQGIAFSNWTVKAKIKDNDGKYTKLLSGI